MFLAHQIEISDVLTHVRLEYPSYVLLWDKEIPPEDQNNSSETRPCRVSDKIIQVRGWDIIVPQQYIMMDTFSRPLFDFFKV